MKFNSLQERSCTAVSGTVNVTIDTTSEESQKLREALAIIEKYKKLAFEHFKKEKKYAPTDSDWHMISYAVKNDKTIVSITDGMAG